MEIERFSAVEGGRYGPEVTASHPSHGVVWLRPAEPGDIPLLHRLSVSDISPVVAAEGVMRAVLDRNSDALWTIEHRDQPASASHTIGYFGFLPLTSAGLDALKAGILNRKDPALDLIAEGGTRPTAMYVWGVVAHRLVRATAPLLNQALAPYVDVPFITISMTEEGLRSARRRGFVPVDARVGDRGGLVFLPMRRLLEPPSARAAHRLDVIVASNAEHFTMDAYIRGAVYGAEQLSPYREEFDGNDFSGSHLIGFVDNEPAAVIRIRYFASFAKLERLAVLERFRKTRIKYEIMQHVIELCRRKGYTKLYGHSQKRLVHFHEQFGFRASDVQRQLVFADHEYVEIELDLEPHSDPITLRSDPYVIIRPEGAWDRPGILDASAVRPPTNPA